VISGLGGSQLDNVYGLGFQVGPPEVPSVLAVPTGPSADQIDAFIDSLLPLPDVDMSSAIYSGQRDRRDRGCPADHALHR
jgi:hypothetical protein